MRLDSRACAVALATLVTLPAPAQTSGAPGGTSAAAPGGAGGATPAPAGTAAGPATGSDAPAAGAGEKPAPPAGPVGGYSWTEKPARKKAAPAKRKRRAAAKGGPLATYPGFRVLPNGASELVLRVSKKVDVRMQKANGRVAFVLPSVHVGIRNNTNPLITTHFDTPLARAQLVEHKDGTDLVLELREVVVPKFSVREAPGGAIALLITLPPPSRTYSEQRASTTGSGALLPGDVAPASRAR